MENPLKRIEVPIFLTGVLILLLLLGWGTTITFLKQTSKLVVNSATLIFSLGLLTGLVSVILGNTKKVLKRSEDWYISAWTIIVACVMFILGIFSNPFGEHVLFTWIFKYVITPISATTFSILLFYMASSTIRTFRARNLDALTLLITTILIMLRQAPIGAAIWSGFGPIGDWILTVPSMAASTAVLFGVAIGGITLVFRLVTGKERGYLRRG